MGLSVIAPALALCIGIGAATRAAEAADLVWLPGSTKRVCQLTGDVDRATGTPTLSLTGKRFAVAATDLGSSFEHKGKLYFLFGDTWGQPGDRDALAWTTSQQPERIVLDFHPGGNGSWLALTVPGIPQGAFEVPSGGISIADTIYVVCTTDHSEARVMGRSVLASSHDDGQTFKALYELSRQAFINVSFWLADDWLYLYGSGEYRRSSVCLARVRPADIADRSSLRYFAGVGADGQPLWSPGEAAAVTLFRHDQVGEVSVVYVAPLKRYVMLYNAGDPRGITMRSAEQPWGPWSGGTVIFEPWRDGGYGHFMHVPAAPDGRRDTLSDPQREGEWGGEYGPYIMSRFAAETAGGCRIYYTMSTWNPYQVVVMRSDLTLGAAPP